MYKRLTKRTVVVEMDKTMFTHDPNTVLVTRGVTTCIVFAVRGLYWDDNDDQIPFCGLFHWSGFPLATTYPNAYAKETLENFFDDLRTELELNYQSDVTISQLIFIGGEHEERDNADNLTLTGSDEEVKALKATLNQFDFNTNHLILTQSIEHHHFLTQGDQSILVNIDINKYSYTVMDFSKNNDCTEANISQNFENIV